VGAVGPGERVVRGTVVLERGVERGHAWVRWGQVVLGADNVLRGLRGETEVRCCTRMRMKNTWRWGWVGEAVVRLHTCWNRRGGWGMTTSHNGIRWVVGFQIVQVHFTAEIPKGFLRGSLHERQFPIQASQPRCCSEFKLQSRTDATKIFAWASAPGESWSCEAEMPETGAGYVCPF
jgi:hypothetical protein